jgi:hypothetical protein
MTPEQENYRNLRARLIAGVKYIRQMDSADRAKAANDLIALFKGEETTPEAWLQAAQAACSMAHEVNWMVYHLSTVPFDGYATTNGLKDRVYRRRMQVFRDNHRVRFFRAGHAPVADHFLNKARSEFRA